MVHVTVTMAKTDDYRPEIIMAEEDRGHHHQEVTIPTIMVTRCIKTAEIQTDHQMICKNQITCRFKASSPFARKKT